MSRVSLSEVLELEVAERIRLAQAIWDSIAEVPDAVPISDADRAEIDRRLDAYYRDPDLGKPWAEVRERLFDRK
jgi:putative addiction module component (TIGR02574 family)